jgi:hypothetical protein
MNMLNTKAFFERKVAELEYKDCVIEKVIKLSGDEFGHFSKNLLKDYDFIKDNASLMHASDGKTHCLLVTGEGSDYGVLVNSEGSGYARYSAMLPNVDSFLAANRYPALTKLSEKLVETVELIAKMAVELRESDSGLTRSFIPAEILENEYSLDIFSESILSSTFIEMLSSFDGVDGVEVDSGELVVYWEPNHFLSASLDADHTPRPLSPLEEVLQAAKIDNPTLGEVFDLTKILIDGEDFRVERAKAILSSGLASVSDVPALIEFMDEDNLLRFDIIPASDEAELGRYWFHRNPNLVPEDIASKDYGSYCVENEKGVFTKWGYVYEREKAEQPTAGLSDSGNKDKDYTSVLQAIGESKTSPKKPKLNPPGKDKTKGKQNKGGDAL